MKTKKLLLVIIGSIIGSSISAQVTFNSLQDVFDYADKHASAIQTSVINEKMSSEKVEQAKSQLYPQITGSTEHNDNINLQPTLVPANFLDSSAPAGEYKKYKFGKQYVSNAMVSVQWSLFDFQKRLAVKAASGEMEASKLSIASSKWDTYMNLASEYYSILMTRKSMNFYKENVKTADLLLKGASQKYAQGMISEDVLDRARIEQINTQKELRANESSLNKLICELQSDLATDQPIAFNDDADRYIDRTDDLNFTGTQPEVKYREGLLNYGKWQLKQTKALNYPTLSLSYEYQYNWASDKFMNYGSGATSYAYQFLGVKMSIPIFTGFNNKHKIKEAKWNVQQQQIQLEDTRIAKNKADEILKIDYMQSKRDFKDADTILNLRQDADSKIDNKYVNGVISLDERLDKYQDLLNEQNNYLKSMGNYLIAQYQVYIRHINF